MVSSEFSQKIIWWYNLNKRNLPWRNTKDPYVIWLSEIILQQTRVEQGLPYFQKFLEKYPSIHKLAAAEEQQILRLWQGLGYYSRARNLHETAKFISEKLDGRFPDSFKELKKLKGVGDYTAAAIASFSFLEPVPVVDGNVYRVLSRYFGFDWDLSKSDTKGKFFEAAQSLIPERTPDTFNQAIMEFGALQCKPKNPGCLMCPLVDSCEAFRLNKIHELPVKTKKQAKKEVYYYYIIFENNQKYLIKTRTGKGIWKGLNEFHLIDFEEAKKEEFILKKIEGYLSKAYSVKSISEEVIHILSHRKIHAYFMHIEVEIEDFELLKSKLGLNDASLQEIEKVPKPILIDNYLNHIVF
ncbi:MAG: A/G-specific adenine glycosylase [Bacteroidota bacterium]